MRGDIRCNSHEQIRSIRVCSFVAVMYIPSSDLKANSHGMFSIYVFGAYVENISSELGYALLFLSTCGKHTK